jgi:hypothetical protein
MGTHLERQSMTVKQVAELEQVGERQIQRYISEGFQGHKLPATRNGRSFSIALDDYKTWRIACGFDEVQIPQVSPPEPVGESAGRSSPGEEGTPAAPPADPTELPAPCAALFPPWPQAADPNGPITNAPDENSSNWPHPEACRIYMAEQLREQQIKLRGYADEE